MEYKKCEHCGEQIHIRSKKCPFCNQTVAEVAPEEIKEVEEKTEEVTQEINEEENNFTNVEETHNTQPTMNVPPQINFEIGSNGQPKDYVYKAEVRHSLEYSNPLSNMAKVLISAFSTFPIFGQMIGLILGVFFSTYDDSDRRSFGRALIFLSVFMFFVYLAYVKSAMELLEGIDINSLYNSLGM